MSEVDVSRIGAIIKVLKDTSHYHSSRFSDDDVALVLKLLKAWDTGMLFPGNNDFLLPNGFVCLSWQLCCSFILNQLIG